MSIRQAYISNLQEIQGYDEMRKRRDCLKKTIRFALNAIVQQRKHPVGVRERL